MKKLFLILILCPVIVWGQAGNKTFTITGKVSGFPEGTEVKLYPNGEYTELAKGKIVKGAFTLKGSVREPLLCFLIFGDNASTEVYVENSKISVTNDKTKPGKYVITGSASHKDFKAFTDEMLPLVSYLSSIANTINSMVPGQDRDALMNTYTATQQNIQKQIDKFVSTKPRSVVAPFVLQITAQFYDDVMLLEKRFLALDPGVRKTNAGKQLEQYIAVNKIGAVGTQSIDFVQPDTTGTPVALSSFRGKYVLVDFWASWCGPCRNENPTVVENYHKFRDKNFTVLGVSLDKPGQKEKWLQAIKEDSLTWSHVSDLLFWENAAAKLYHVTGIPQNFLIDPEGKIIAKNLRGPALQAKLCEVLGCN